ncbi:MAG: hypothetical protein AAFX40_10520 [Cyanobacteria bacterium J06639_1]
MLQVKSAIAEFAPATRPAIAMGLPVVSVRHSPQTGWSDWFVGNAEQEFRYCRSAIDATAKVAIHYLPSDCEAIAKLRRAPEGVPARLWQTLLKEVRSRQSRR